MTDEKKVCIFLFYFFLIIFVRHAKEELHKIKRYIPIRIQTRRMHREIMLAKLLTRASCVKLSRSLQTIDLQANKIGNFPVRENAHGYSHTVT